MVFVVSLGIAFLLTLAGTVALVRGVSETRISERFTDQNAAFHLAEAGLDDAIQLLRNPSTTDWDTWTGTGGPVTLGGGTYQTTVAQSGNLRIVQTSSQTTGAVQTPSRVEAVLRRTIPPNFYDNAIYGAGSIDLDGNAYVVDGEVLTGDMGPIDNTQNITCDTPPCLEQDASADPLARLSFAELYQIALSQGNVYDADRLQDIQQNQDAFPTTFCWGPPTDPDDPSTCTPNVNYIVTDLVLNGNIGTIGGFFVVVGNVISNPASTEDTTINGNGQVEGIIYTTGDFVVNGGGGGLNVNGGVLAGDLARLNGNVTIAYNETYMKTLKKLDINPDIQVMMWRECPPAGCS